MSKKHQAQLRKIDEKMSLENRANDLSRARSVTVGTCFGGTTELIMRANDGHILWTPMQPAEVVELIHQLAANVGCHIHVQPRKDFSSWREWNLTEAEKLHYNGHAAFVNDMAPFNQLGISGVDQALIERLKVEGFQGTEGGKGGVRPLFKEQELLSKGKENVVATKKTVNRRSTKRSAKAS
tara:strand:+ start:117 stop:662 length:546 start_codon:yes stop_codon:yes gene_type:complete